MSDMTVDAGAARRGRPRKPAGQGRTSSTYLRMTTEERGRLERLAAIWGLDLTKTLNRAVELAAMAAGAEPPPDWPGAANPPRAHPPPGDIATGPTKPP